MVDWLQQIERCAADNYLDDSEKGPVFLCFGGDSAENC